MATWQRAPTHTIAGMMELYEEMLPTKVYSYHKIGTTPENDQHVSLEAIVFRFPFIFFNLYGLSALLVATCLPRGLFT